MHSPVKIVGRTSGFTLIELMVTISVAAVMLTLAAPSFISYQRNSELTTAATSYSAALSAARGEAMKRQLNTLVRPVSGNSWTTGWMIYSDVDWDFAYTAGTDVQIYTQAAVAPTLSVDVDTTASDATSHYIMFSGAGFLRNQSGGTASSAAVEFKSSTGEKRLVIVSPAGRMRVCNPDKDANCTSSDTL
jgi:type IV fimbrial biogenesis protein FimT